MNRTCKLVGLVTRYPDLCIGPVRMSEDENGKV